MDRFVLISLMFCLSSCGIGQIDVGVHSHSDGVWRGPSYGRYMSGTCYAVGLDYPDGYDWRADTENGTVRCYLVLFADGVPVLRIPAGDAHEVSSDQARHRLCSGCLYTDYTDGVTTVIKKDGVELFRYDGAEEVMCMKVHDGRVHSLSSVRDRAGFVYRVDGRQVLERSDGKAFFHLDEYADSVSFCFCQDKVTAEGTERRYYRVTEGIVNQLESDVSEVWDMRVFEGEACMVVPSQDGTPVLVRAGMREEAVYMNIYDPVSCAFCDTGRLCISLRCHHSDGSLSDILWLGDRKWILYRKGHTLSSVLADEKGCCAVINPADGRSGVIFDGYMGNAVPEGYGVWSKDCMVRKDSVLYVGLSSGLGSPPVIWENGALDTLDINGPITCLQ